MTAVTLTAPAQGTMTASTAGKPAADAGAGFADALLALLDGPAAETMTGTGQQQPDTDADTADPGEGQLPAPAEAPAAPPQFTLPAVAAPQAHVTAGAPAAPEPSPALPAPLPGTPAAAPQPALADVPQNQSAAAVLSGMLPDALPAQRSAPGQRAAAEDGQAPADRAPSAPAPGAPAQFAPVQPGMPLGLAPAEPGQGFPFTAAGPVAAAVPAAPLVKVPALAAPAAPAPTPAPGTHPAASPDALPVPVSDAAAAFGQVAAAAGPPQPASASAATPAAQDLQVPRGYTAQLARPLFTIATAGPGQHTMTVEVNPQNLGPVTLQAHSDADGIRIEMIAATSDGREALRQALPELRKDLAGAGISASLDLSSSGQGSAQGGQDRESFTRRLQTSNQPPDSGRLLEVKAQNTPTRPGLYGPETTLDVLA